MKIAFRVLGINVLVLLGLLFIAEIFTRSYLLVRSCAIESCKFDLLRSPPQTLREKGRGLDLSGYDPILGYAPHANISVKMPDSVPDWHGVSVLTDSMGLRKNGQHSSAEKEKTILIAGDSFTFGAQVEGEDTWGACIERQTGMGVLNAGVWGYGTAQSLLRIETLIDRHRLQPNLIILSTLVGGDFDRDRYDFRGGHSRAAVIKKSTGELAFALPPDRNTIGSRYTDQETSYSRHRLPIERVYDASWAFRLGLDLVMPDYMSNGKFRLTRLHKSAAKKEEIIDWTLARFAAREENVLFLLQYVGPPWTGESVNSERAYLLSRLNELGLPYVDTYFDIFESGRDVTSLYYGHHNPLGNELVCKTILANAKFFQ